MSLNMDPSAQLRTELNDSAGRSLRTDDGELAPVLTHLNDDTSWLCQLPVTDPAWRQAGREYYNILIDPWLKGHQVDIGRWFSEQWHTTRSKVESISEVEDLIRGRAEAAAAAAHERQGRPPRKSQSGSWQTDPSEKSPIDAVVISYEFTDHCHKETLLEVDSDVPVFATKKPADLIRSWKHFHIVKDIVNIDESGDWRRTTFHPLPNWVGIGRLGPRGGGLSYIHGAILISFSLGQPPSPATQTILYTPHGIIPENVERIRRAQPPLETLALLHGANDVSFGGWSWGQLTLGAPNGVKLQQALRPKYWIGTHDGNKKASGLISYILQWQTWSVSEILKMASEGRQKHGEENGSEPEEDGRFVVVGNGECIVLR